MGDTQELIERLREKNGVGRASVGYTTFINPDGPEAADTIESLQRREEKLREALRLLVGETLGGDLWEEHGLLKPRGSYSCWVGWEDRWQARQALEDTDSGPADAPNGGTTLQEEQS